MLELPMCHSDISSNTGKIMRPRLFEDLQIFTQLTDEAEYMPLFSVTDEEEPVAGEAFPELLPVLPLKNTVLFPGIVIPITIGRDKSVRAIRKAHDSDKYIAVLSQQDDKSESPSVDELYKTGTIAKILKLLKMPDGSITAIIQGRGRFRLIEMVSESPYLEAKVENAPYSRVAEDLQFEATLASIRDLAEKIIKLSPQIPNEAI